MMRTATVSLVPWFLEPASAAGLRRVALAAILFAVILLAGTGATQLTAQPPATPQPTTPQPQVRPPVETGKIAARAAELRAVLARIRQEQQAARAAGEAWRREKAELDDEFDAVSEDTRRLRSDLERMRRRTAELEARAVTGNREAEAAAARDRSLRSWLVRTFAWMHALNDSSLPAGRDARRERIVSLWREAVRDETAISSVASTLFGAAFRWLSDSRTFEALEAVIPAGTTGERRAVEVLRIGLVDAIALTPDDAEARSVVLDAKGRPIWGPPANQPGLIERVRDGIEIIGRRRTPEVIVLPLRDRPAPPPAPPMPQSELPTPAQPLPARSPAPEKESRP